MQKRHRQRGFTLIEVMVTCAIVAILSAIAYPAYSSYLVRGNRLAAQEHLLELAQKEQEFLIDSRAYVNTVAGLNMTTPASVASNYTISIAVQPGPPPAFIISATPIGGSKQASDGALTIDSSGAKTPGAKW